MSDLKGNYLENAYEILSPLQDTENCSAFLVKENSTGSLAVKKQLTFEQYELYQVLKEYTHPNLSKIYALYTCNGCYYALTEYISGATIFQTVEQGRTFSREEVRTYILQLCDVLFFLHKRGIIHRDITPGNIIISTDHVVKLIDFGIARIKKDGQTRDTQLLGTAGFASPEQFGFGQTDERSDIYSTGVLINYMLTGKLPAQKLSSDIFLSDIIVKCTQIDPANRFSNVEELHSVLLRRIPAASAAAVWPLYMTPTQETDATVETLNAGMTPTGSPYDELVNASIAQVKPGGTVTACIAYNANYADKPVTLTAVASFMGEELGTKTIELQ
ncbi:protein kinase [Faecalicatena acetigenes]|uniref:non-specific serine/threonine protein kinase n=1 Tax=Faecalicatena acetigenes TaxID=2981790 RepID=A0ABT2TDD4_9FIRM|nr:MULTISPECIES: serine/threonine-protein kinase [Lachnospiraceae]MCU6748267.1 protein kinase [Faecalicatena acetigenes]SCI35186.1 Serine/threonine-protein kinase PrkC [uncultured Clostridium sp.]